jgi:hypothetical protein
VWGWASIDTGELILPLEGWLQGQDQGRAHQYSAAHTVSEGVHAVGLWSSPDDVTGEEIDTPDERGTREISREKDPSWD